MSTAIGNLKSLPFEANGAMNSPPASHPIAIHRTARLRWKDLATLNGSRDCGTIQLCAGSA